VRKFITFRTILGTVLIVATLGALAMVPDSATAWQFAKERIDIWREWVQANFALAILLYLIVYVSILTPPIPLAAVTAMVGGALFGPWWGTGILSAGGITAATLAFVLARYLLHDWVERHFGHRLTRLKAGVDRDGALYVIALRWVPVIPFFVINMSLALTPIPLRKYIWVSWLAMLPFAVAYAVVGSQIARLDSPKDAFSPSFIAVVSGAAFVPLLLKWVVRRFVKGDARVTA